MSKRWVNAIFCDDVRQEQGGKTSLMGMYGTEMIVAEFPFTLPRLVALVKLRADQSDTAEVIKFVVYNDDHVIADSQMKIGELNLASDGSSDSSTYVACCFVFGPIQFVKSAEIRVAAFFDDEEVQGNSLMVRAAREDEAKRFGFASPAAIASEPDPQVNKPAARSRAKKAALKP